METAYRPAFLVTGILVIAGGFVSFLQSKKIETERTKKV